MDNIKQSLADAVEKNADKLKDFARRLGELDLSRMVDGFANIAGAVMRLGEVLAPLVETITKIPGLLESIMVALAVEKLNGIAGGVGNISNSFGGLQNSLRRTTRELKVMHRTAKGAASAIAAIVGGSVAGAMSGAEAEGSVDLILGGASTGAAVFAATGNPVFAGLAAGGSMIAGSIASQVNGYNNVKANEAKTAELLAQGKEQAKDIGWFKSSYEAFANASKNKKKDSGAYEFALQAFQNTMAEYGAKYGEDAAMGLYERLSGTASSDAKANVTNFNITNNNTVTQNNSISSEYSELVNRLKQEIVELMERNLKFDTSMVMEVSGA